MTGSKQIYDGEFLDFFIFGAGSYNIRKVLVKLGTLNLDCRHSWSTLKFSWFHVGPMIDAWVDDSIKPARYDPAQMTRV